MWEQEERRAWLSRERFHQANEVVVREQSQAGEASVKFTSNEPLLSLSSPDNNPLYFLQERKLADGIVLQVGERGVSVHLVECKRTIREKSWATVKLQWAGALQTALALCGVLGLPNPNGENIYLYSAYRTEKLSADENVNPVLLKRPVGGSAMEPKPSSIEWEELNVNVLGRTFTHHKIQLDDEGNGSFQIGVNM